MTTDESLSRVADRLDIIELTAKHGFLVDTKNIDPLIDLWSDNDPVFDESEVGLKKITGKAAIREYLENDVFGNFHASCHLTSNHIIENITADTATGSHTVIFKGDVKGGGPAEASAYYQDRYVREDGRWKFASRKVIALTQMVLGGYELPQQDAQ
jgi:ketosteroid isomerase-like protein